MFFLRLWGIKDGGAAASLLEKFFVAYTVEPLDIEVVNTTEASLDYADAPKNVEGAAATLFLTDCVGDVHTLSLPRYIDGHVLTVEARDVFCA